MVTFYALRCFERRARAHGRRGKGKPVAGAMVMTKKTVPANNERNEDAIVLTSNFLRQAILSCQYPNVLLDVPLECSLEYSFEYSPPHSPKILLRLSRPLHNILCQILFVIRHYSLQCSSSIFYPDIPLIFFPPISSPNTNDDEECEDPEVHWKARCQSESAPK